MEHNRTSDARFSAIQPQAQSRQDSLEEACENEIGMARLRNDKTSQ